MSFPFLTVIMIFIIFLAVRYRSIDRKQDDVTRAFWEREQKANAVPTADLDNIKYITIPLDKFPLGFSKDPDILAMERELRELSQKRLLNLTGKTNTELKERYGVANLTTMQSIGEDFDRLTVLLRDYGSALIDAGRLADAISVLEFGAAIKTDISQNYILLGNCYKALGKTDKIQYLLQQIETSDLMLTSHIQRHLQDLLSDQITTDAIPSPENFETADTGQTIS